MRCNAWHHQNFNLQYCSREQNKQLLIVFQGKDQNIPPVCNLKRHQEIVLPWFPWLQEKRRPKKWRKMLILRIIHIWWLCEGNSITAFPSVGISQRKYFHRAQFCARVDYLHLLCPLHMASPFCSRAQHWLHAIQNIRSSMNGEN
jgi:hypothetical protein